VWWHTPAIPAIGEAEVGEFWFKLAMDKKPETLTEK
jgi:hypothetical protein